MIKTSKIFLEEPELIIALQQRKKIGAEALYSMYSASLLGIIQRVIADNEIAEDVSHRAESKYTFVNQK